MKIQDNIILDISKDGLEAYISFLKNNEKSADYIADKIIEEIKTKIKFGLDEKLINDIIENKIQSKEKCIANGKNPIDGKDGKIKYYFKAERKLIPKLKEDGTVDYRELNSINNVSEDEILAEIIPPSPGVDGIKVTGEKIPFKRGKAQRFKKGKNTYISKDGLYLKSSINGIIKMNNGNIKVYQLLIVDNIDSSVGNIDFIGNVTVNKNILNGFKLKAAGVVEVKGCLEGGHIESKEDILIKQGIQGFNKLSIDTKGSLGTRFIENAIVNVEGNITAEAIMHSNINCKSNILLVGKKGLIVGGTCRANGEIRAKIIGSNMATKTVIEVGIDPGVKERHNEIEKEIESNKDNINKIKQSLKILEVLKQSKNLDDKKKELYEKLLRAEKTISLKNKILEKEYIKINGEMENLSRGKIKVADIIYPGSKLVIGKNVFYVREEMKRCTFFVENGEIRVGSY